MRLLKRSSDGTLSLTDDLSGNDIPKEYAILSHTWIHGQEVTLQEFKDGKFKDGTGKEKAGYQKIQLCSDLAAHHGLQYFWVDTCCIDKSNEKELTTAINSMFRWYENAARCFVCLSDVSRCTLDGQFVHVEWQSSFRNSRWFKRGWTLQELLAPKIVDFYSQEGVLLGDKVSLEQQITGITGIPTAALQGQPLSTFGIDERLSWVGGRRTTEEEDRAYCLLGMFGIFLPLIYGEGQTSAMRRLRREIINNDSESTSIVLYNPFYSTRLISQCKQWLSIH
jgi:hypothetical protein